MFKNENGSSLLVVLLMMLTFTVLGISILSASIGGAKRTSIREDEVTHNLDAIKEVNEGIAYIKSTINSKYTATMDITEYQKVIEEILSNPAKYEIIDVSTNFNIDLNVDYTRVFDVSSSYNSAGNKYTQRLYVTAMPSFLKYALGSRKDLTMNGSIYVKDGDIYANEALFLSDEARYIFNSERKTRKTELSIASPNSNIEIYGPIQYCSTTSCYRDSEMNPRHPSAWRTIQVNELSKGFEKEEYTPRYFIPDEKYIEVNIPRTMIDKLIELGVSATYIETSNSIQFNQLSYMVENILNTSEATNSNKSYYINKDIFIEPNSRTFGNEPLFKIEKGQWLIIDGDAHIENIGTEKLNVQANLLITGNLTIKGDVAFDSTVYVLGNADVIDANITGFSYDNGNTGELILLNEKTLKIAKINKFSNPDFSSYKLNAYFYTASDAQLYAVGSYISITGGLFARGDLEVNSFRGTVSIGSEDLNFTPSRIINDSRLVISNNKTLFINQSQGLPRVNQLLFLTDPIEKN
ncbi:hypothetical protein SM124_03435 (plasmid) [Bacillus sp. 31A1R]|uniref:Uncharacterized protein n=1 Tax=Robertmurraya mangrovi TaxID=3098077 RepID=A0ABU5IUI8_9BACI|nr:hypothetical protein [Bacillus sp. 31A1R]MDZ5470798.1 hypothetical protein [Bacillus sp. 31A1R]